MRIVCKVSVVGKSVAGMRSWRKSRAFSFQVWQSCGDSWRAPSYTPEASHLETIALPPIHPALAHHHGVLAQYQIVQRVGYLQRQFLVVVAELHCGCQARIELLKELECLGCQGKPNCSASAKFCVVNAGATSPSAPFVSACTTSVCTP